MCNPKAKKVLKLIKKERKESIKIIIIIKCRLNMDYERKLSMITSINLLNTMIDYKDI